MKNSEFEPFAGLTSEKTYVELRAALKKRALAQVRRRGIWRRSAAGLGYIVAGLIMFYSLLRVGQRSSPLQVSPPSSSLASGSMDHTGPARTSSADETGDLRHREIVSVQSISDSELLALFPPGSVFLADLNGRTHLVFRDDDLRRKVLR